MPDNTSSKTVFFALIRAALTGERSDVAVDGRVLRSILSVGSFHGVLPLLFAGAEACGCGESAVSALKEACDRDMFDFVLRDRAIGGVRGALDGAGVPYVPLKGAVLCELYPEKWMRTSGDVDILVREGDLDRAVAAIEEKTALRASGRNYHDVVMTGGGVCLELHFSILENSPSLDPALARVWDNVSPSGEGAERRMSAEYLAFHVAAHMSYHLAHGGLGVRPYIDLWFLRRRTSFNEDAVREMCRECGILKFYDAAALLGEVWLGDDAHTPVTKDMERLCFHGGVFGSTRGAEASMRLAGGGSLRERIFQPKAELAEAYPEVMRRPYLAPYYQAKRWGASLRRKNVAKKLRAIRETSPAQTAALERVVSELELEV